ncbi:MAG: rhamnulokinase [Bacteroidales bacterium]|nr:rhamnulokinase [Bacteroidales bacterium]
MEKNYIAVDLGATSGRVILAKVTGEALEMETIHRFPTPLLQIGGKYCWNIYSIYDDIVKGLSMVGKRGVKVESIGVDTWGVDFVCVAKDGTLLALPRSYRDPYTEGIPEKFFKKMPREDLYDRTGIQIMNINSVFQLYAQHKESSVALDKARSILFMPDAFSYLLTGKKVCEYTILSTSALMNPRTKKLDRKVLGVCHVCPRKFPSIVYPGEKVGRLTSELAEKTGLGKVNVIAVAGHDTASAVAAVPALSEGFAYLSSGTWSLMGIELKQPVINDRSFSMNFTNEGGVGGTTRFLKNITGMWLLEQCLVKWRSEGKEYSYAELAKMSAECAASERLIDPDAPEFAAPTDMPEAICRYCRDHGFEAPADDAHLVRLIYDSLAGKYAETFRNLQETAPFKIEALHIIGGGSQNELLDQMTADACGVTVVAGPAEGTALGNVMIQAKLSRKDINKFIDTKIFKPHTK